MIPERRNFNNNIGRYKCLCVCVFYQNHRVYIIVRFRMIINKRRIQVSSLHHWNYLSTPMAVMVERFSSSLNAQHTALSSDRGLRTRVNNNQGYYDRMDIDIILILAGVSFKQFFLQ